MTTHSLAGRRNFLKSVAGTLCVPRMQHGIGALFAITSFLQPKGKERSMSPEEMRSKWEMYGKAWSPITEAERKQLLQNSLTPNFSYIDPRIECHGHADVIRNLEAFQQRQPGGSFALKSILPHHDVALVNWQLIKPDGTGANLGFDFVRFAPSGLIESITGFFVPPSTT